MTPPSQFRLCRLADSRIHRQAAKSGFRLAERTRVMRSRKTGGCEGIFRRHPEVDHFENQLDRRLVLEVAAGNRDGRYRLTVLEEQRWRQRNSRPLAGLDRIRMSFPGMEPRQAASVNDARLSGNARRTG